MDAAKGKSKGKGKAPAVPGTSAGKGEGKAKPAPAKPAPVDVMDEAALWVVEGEQKALLGDEFEMAFSKIKALPSSWMPLTREKFASLSAWQQKQAVAALAEKVPVDYKFPHDKARPMKSLQHIPWKTCVGVQRSDGGSEGVLFVEFAGHEAVVIKVPFFALTEASSTKLCQLMGVPCPEMRAVRIDSEEGKEIKETLLRLDAKRAPEERKVEKMLDHQLRTAFLIMEYLKADELADHWRDESDGSSEDSSAATQWCQSTFGLPGDDLSSLGKANLQAMGKLIAFDIVVCNFDRLPCGFPAPGNPSNVMFGLDTHALVSIDNVMMGITPDKPESYEMHLKTLRELCFASVARPERAQQEFSRVREFLKVGCRENHGWLGLGIDIGEEGVCEIQRGFAETIRTVASRRTPGGDESMCRPALWQLQTDVLKDLFPGGLEWVQQFATKDWNTEKMMNTWVDSMDVQFGVFCEVAAFIAP